MDIVLKGFVKCQDRRLQRQLHQDEEGLSLLAYALGAALIVAPLAIAMMVFGMDAADSADSQVETALTGSP